MPLSLPFCDAVGCDQARIIRGGNLTCNLCDQLIYGMTPADCPRMIKAFAEARTEGRQQAAAELDRSAGQPVQTYVQKQSLIHLIVSTTEEFHKSAQVAETISKQAAILTNWHISSFGDLLKDILTGTQLKEVEL